MQEVRLFQNQIYVKASPIHGLGVFAGKDIQAGEKIEECYSIQVSKNNPAFNNFVYKFESQAWLPLGYGSIYNHSQYYNADYLFDSANATLIIIAERDIKKDEEILVYYNKKWFSSRQIACKELSWKYFWHQRVMPMLAIVSRFLLVTIFLYMIIHFKFF